MQTTAASRTEQSPEEFIELKIAAASESRLRTGKGKNTQAFDFDYTQLAGLVETAKCENVSKDAKIPNKSEHMSFQKTASPPVRRGKKQQTDKASKAKGKATSGKTRQDRQNGRGTSKGKGKGKEKGKGKGKGKDKDK